MSSIFGNTVTFAIGAISILIVNILVIIEGELFNANEVFAYCIAILIGLGHSITLVQSLVSVSFSKYNIYQVQAMANELVAVDKANAGFCYGVLNFMYNLIAGQ